MTKPKFDLYQHITDKIVKQLEQGTIPWIKPWKNSQQIQAGMPYNGKYGYMYNGINVMLLWAEGYDDDRWMTFKQIADMGGNVKKGESGTIVTFWKFIEEKDKETGEKTGKRIPFLKYSKVFNFEQTENIDESKLKAPEVVVNEDTDVLQFVENAGISVTHGGNKACFIPALNRVQMPNQKQFKEMAEYESTLLHEATHATGHKSRLDRDLNNRFGSNAYAFEELVAEIGSAYLCAMMNVQNNELQHTAYIQNWLEVLKNDKRAIFKASTLSKKAVEFLLSAQESEEVNDQAA